MTLPDYTAALVAQCKEVDRLQTAVNALPRAYPVPKQDREQLAREWAKLRLLLAKAPKEFKQLNLL